MRQNPTVSVVIPTYNRVQSLQEAIQSVLDQTYQDFEVIVVDDGSTDGTNEMVKKMADPSGHIRYIHQGNQGVSAARNYGIQEARGKYIAFLDSDDLFLPNKLEYQVGYLDNNSSVGLVHSSFINVDVHNNEIGITKARLQGHVYKKCLFGCAMMPSMVMIRSGVFEKVGRFDEELRIGEDTDLWIRIARHFKIGAISAPLVKYRVHQGNPHRDPDILDKVYWHITRKQLTHENLGWLLKRRLRAKTYFTSGHNYVSSVPPQIRAGGIRFLKGILIWPFIPRGWLLGLRLLFRTLMPVSVQQRCRAYWRKLYKIDK
jgi:glycosyltransferase involved in cell wall biosynthesis